FRELGENVDLLEEIVSVGGRLDDFLGRKGALFVHGADLGLANINGAGAEFLGLLELESDLHLVEPEEDDDMQEDGDEHGDRGTPGKVVRDGQAVGPPGTRSTP